MRTSAEQAGAGDLVDRLFGLGPADTDRTRRGWFGTVVAVGWLLYLVPQILDCWTARGAVPAVGATLAMVAFGALIATSFVALRTPDTDDTDPPPADPRVWPLLAAMAALSVVLMALLGPAALPTTLYLAAVAVFTLPNRRSLPVVAAASATVLLVPVVVGPRWWMGGTALVLAVIPPVIWLAREVGRRGRRLQALARRQRADLAIAADRDRVARDVHDILGHSLTVITVKTELAQRLVDVDIDRARAELVDVERLAREALAGVRETVGGLREVSLRRELATARTALTAAGITATLPDPDLEHRHSELFGWVLREAVTNVVRHSGATHCTVVVTETAIEISDDGHGFGADATPGSGLAGLRERLADAGGTLSLSTEGGVRLRATAPAGRNPR